MKSKLFIFLSVFMVMLSASAISAADTNNLNATDAPDINDASLAVEIDSTNVDTQTNQAESAADDSQNAQQKNDMVDIDPELQKIIDNLPFEIDPSLIPLLTEGVTPQVKNTEPVADSLKDLQKLIDETPEGSTLTLTHNYFRTNDCTQVNINKDITIDGNGYSISFGGSSGHVISKKGNVVLKNLEINSANNGINDLSALAILKQANCIIDNCKFYNNRGAGAIYGKIDENNKIIVNNCYFKGNEAKEGGAIFICSFDNTLKIENSTFKENSAKDYGGAVFSYSDVNLKNCTFKENFLYDGFYLSYGGAIFSVGEVNDDESSFIDNIGQTYGGAIACKKDNTENTHFEGNKAKHGTDVMTFEKITLDNFWGNYRFKL